MNIDAMCQARKERTVNLDANSQARKENRV